MSDITLVPVLCAFMIDSVVSPDGFDLRALIICEISADPDGF